MLYLLIEHFPPSGPAPVYARLRARGRQLPAGLRFVGSWVTADLGRCFQVMEEEERGALQAWMRGWEDLVRFEAVEVLEGAEVARRFAEAAERQEVDEVVES